MKKTFTLSIGGTLFHVEEDAYEKLDSYLASVRAHFEGDDSKDEIVSDIESRIAEKFSEKNGAIINMKDVEDVIALMGTVEQFDDAPQEESASSKTVKRLYRDTDNEIIAGVASGLGHFFGVDPIIFRLLFIVSLIAGGSSVVIYLILWLLVPPAKTPSQKLAMKGTPPTIHAMADMLKKKLEEVQTPKHRSALKEFLLLPITFIRALARIVKDRVVPVVGMIVGFFMASISFGLAVAATIGVSFLLFSDPQSLFDGPLQSVASGMSAHIFALALYVVALIPLIFSISLGVYFMTKRKTLSKIAILSLLGIWFVAIGASAGTGVRLGLRASDIVENDPYYQSQTTTQEVKPFSELIVNDQSVRIVQGETYRVEVRGTAQSLPTALITEGTSTLTISQGAKGKRHCLFCEPENVQVALTVPDLSSITVTNTGRVYGEYKGNALTLNADNGSSADMTLTLQSAKLSAEDASRISLVGVTGTLTAIARNSSSIDADSLQASTAELTAMNLSRIQAYVKRTLSAGATNMSRIEYAGSPQVTEDIDKSSSLEARDHEE